MLCFIWKYYICSGNFSSVGPTIRRQVSYTSNKHVETRKIRWWNVFWRFSDVQVRKRNKKEERPQWRGKSRRSWKTEEERDIVTPLRSMIHGVSEDLIALLCGKSKRILVLRKRWPKNYHERSGVRSVSDPSVQICKKHSSVFYLVPFFDSPVGWKINPLTQDDVIVVLGAAWYGGSDIESSSESSFLF